MSIWVYLLNDVVIGYSPDKQAGDNWVEVEEDDPRYQAYVNPQPTLAAVKEACRTALRTTCSEEIERTSFPSSALGAVHNYDCRIVDQINLKMRYDIALSENSEEPLWASDGTRFEWKEHTASELMEVMVDMNTNIKAKQQKLVIKLAAVDAATTVAQAEAVSWD